MVDSSRRRPGWRSPGGHTNGSIHRSLSIFILLRCVRGSNLALPHCWSLPSPCRSSLPHPPSSPPSLLRRSLTRSRPLGRQTTIRSVFSLNVTCTVHRRERNVCVTWSWCVGLRVGGGAGGWRFSRGVGLSRLLALLQLGHPGHRPLPVHMLELLDLKDTEQASSNAQVVSATTGLSINTFGVNSVEQLPCCRKSWSSWSFLLWCLSWTTVSHFSGSEPLTLNEYGPHVCASSTHTKLKPNYPHMSILTWPDGPTV